jgi:hypothetical protein
MSTSRRFPFAHHPLLTATAFVAMTSLGCAQVSQAASLPPHFQSNAKADVGPGLRCVVGNATVQSDTTSEASLSQTFVDVVTFDAGTGRLESVDPVKVPNVHGATSNFVDEGDSNFRLVDGKPVVTGQYFQVSNRDDIKPFIASPEHTAATSGSGTEGKSD